MRYFNLTVLRVIIYVMDEILYNFYHYLFYGVLSINHVPACVSLSVVNVSYATFN